MNSFELLEELATDCVNHYLGRIEGYTDHFETLRKVFLKGAEAAIATAWHAWPNEQPPHDGKYLVVQSSRHRDVPPKICVRSFRDGNWIFSCKTQIDYWMETPQLPKHIQL